MANRGAVGRPVAVEKNAYGEPGEKSARGGEGSAARMPKAPCPKDRRRVPKNLPRRGRAKEAVRRAALT